MTQPEPDQPPPASATAPAEPDLTAVLAGRAGRYAGRGIDQDGSEFDGTLTVRTVADGAAVVLDIGVDQPGEPAYQEHGVLARGEDGGIQYVSVSSNAPFHRTFRLRRTERADGAARAVYGWGGAPELTAGFREEITLTAHDGGDLGLGWAWGGPGEAFGPRSAVRLSPAAHPGS
ncbi:MAG TPA: hypothetical protein VMU51_14445 [Mycobacteriales bacterium]|nr:hypothetical protein [Mycobacteriales bacterium]